MIATGDDLSNVLRLLGAAFPTFPLDELTIETYVRTLTRGPLDASLLNAAAVTWVAENDRFPTVHQLSDAYLVESRRRQAQRRAAEDARIQAAGQLPGVSIDPGYAVEMVDVMREAMSVIGGGKIRHHHPGGDDSRCPTCSRADELAMEVAAAAVRIAAERGLRPPPGADTYSCPDCSDNRFVVISDEPLVTRPCSGCNVDGYERWADGHLMPNHSCAECADLRRGR